MMLSMLIIDKWWWLMLPGLILGVYAQWKLMSTYNKYLEVSAMNGVSGAEAARTILDDAGLFDVGVQEIEGQLSDHYDPTKRALFLSSDNYNGRSLSSVGVAAHEAGHALQHKDSYAPLQIRMSLVPITQFASTAIYGIMILSFFMHLAKLAAFAVIVFGIITLFQLITLPVEFDASNRAKERLFSLGIISPTERSGISKVLNAAAMTYVAAMVTSVMELLHWALILRGDDRE